MEIEGIPREPQAWMISEMVRQAPILVDARLMMVYMS
jgi:hypothetical protein